MNKQYEFVITQADGTFVTRLPARPPLVPPSDRKTVRNFRPRIVSEINQGQGQLNIDLDALFDDFGEGSDISHGYLLKLYLYDENHPAPTGILIYSGIITTYEPRIEGNIETLKLMPIGIVSELNNSYFKVGGNRTFNINKKASEIFQDIITHFKTVYTDSDIAYTGGSVEDSGTVLDIDFANVKWLDAIKTAQKSAPTGWWWRVDPDGTAHFKSKPSTATHTFEMQRHVERIVVNKTIDSVKNDIILESSAPSTPHTASDATSISSYGTRTLIISDSNIQDDTTAAARVAKELADRKDPKRRVAVTINEQYDLESIKPGDTCKIIGEKIGSSLLNSNMQIVRVDYSQDMVTITLEEDQHSIIDQLQQIIDA